MASKDGVFKEGQSRRLRRLAAVAFALAASAAMAGTVPAQKPPAKPAAPPHPVTTPAQRCSALEKQFDVALLKGMGSHSLAAAKKLRAEGEHLCEEGRHAAGALRLSEALADLGLQPQEP